MKHPYPTPASSPLLSSLTPADPATACTCPRLVRFPKPAVPGRTPENTDRACPKHGRYFAAWDQGKEPRR